MKLPLNVIDIQCPQCHEYAPVSYEGLSSVGICSEFFNCPYCNFKFNLPSVTERIDFHTVFECKEEL